MLAMKAEAKTFRLSRRLSIEITAGVDGIEVEWNPSIPREVCLRDRDHVNPLRQVGI